MGVPSAAGGSLALIGNRHSARLRSALAGKNKSDPIDAAVLSRVGPAGAPGCVEHVRRVRPSALAVLGRWPHLREVSRARTATISDVIAAHTRGVADVGERAERVREAAKSWCEFWADHLDLDALAWETAELLDDLDAAESRVARATDVAQARWEGLQRGRVPPLIRLDHLHINGNRHGAGV